MLAAATAGYTTATAVADALVELGVPFREGHHIVGSLVARAEAAGVELTELPDGDIAAVLAASADPHGTARGLRPGRWPASCARPRRSRTRWLARTSSAAPPLRACRPSSTAAVRAGLGRADCRSLTPARRAPARRRPGPRSMTTSAGTGCERKSGIDSL